MSCRGKVYEDIAVDYLKELGYHILFRNYRCRYGEIDIVALEGETLVLVEVKGGKDPRLGDPSERFTEDKFKRILKCAYHLVSSEEFRIDLIVVTGKDIKHFKNLGFIDF